MLLLRILAGVFAATLLVAQTPAEATAQTNKAFTLLTGEKYQALFAMFTPEMQAALPVERLREQVGPTMRSLGPVKSQGKPTVTQVDDNHVVIIPVVFTKANINFQCAVTQAGKISGMFLRPGQ